MSVFQEFLAFGSILKPLSKKMRPVLKRDYSPKNWEAGGDDKTAILDIPHDIFMDLSLVICRAFTYSGCLNKLCSIDVDSQVLGPSIYGK